MNFKSIFIIFIYRYEDLTKKERRVARGTRVHPIRHPNHQTRCQRSSEAHLKISEVEAQLASYCIENGISMKMLVKSLDDTVVNDDMDNIYNFEDGFRFELNKEIISSKRTNVGIRRWSGRTGLDPTPLGTSRKQTQKPRNNTPRDGSGPGTGGSRACSAALP